MLVKHGLRGIINLYKRFDSGYIFNFIRNMVFLKLCKVRHVSFTSQSIRFGAPFLFRVVSWREHLLTSS